MSLKEYNKKRDFKSTSEPEGRKNQENANRFVFQRHRASHLHYDLRLEIDGVLKSWAIPKGPSMNPDDKRLAVQTEDHPVKYLFFEGVIPKGNYGAGTMSIWDNGHFSIEGNPLMAYEKGDIKITFNGKKLKGAFALVRTRHQEKQVHWLLIKKEDKFSVTTFYNPEMYKEGIHAIKSPSTEIKLMGSIKPMLASPSAKVFNDKDWIYELKYDGYRVIAHIHGNNVQLQSRNGISLNEKFSMIAKQLESINHDAILDGEVIYANKEGVPNFSELQNYPEVSEEGQLQYMVFDILYLNGHETTGLPLIDRKSLLKDLITNEGSILYSDHLESMGKTLYDLAISKGMEGIMAKKKTSLYHPGFRTENWLKVKDKRDSEAIICGYTISEKSRPFGSLILGMIEDNELRYVGNCGSGFSHSQMQSIKKQMDALIAETHPFKQYPNLKGRKPVWISPNLICDISFAEWTKANHLRHPVFIRMRDDKEIPDQIEINYSKEDISETVKTSGSFLEIDGFNVPVSNLEKIYWPESGYTKFDLIDYYIKMAPTILPYLIDRPQSLNRHPNGINGESFYQKDNEHLPSWIERHPVHSKSNDRIINYLLCQNEATLIYMANLGCIEINPWHSSISSLDYPDYTIIDLDPSKENTFKEILEVALVAKNVIDKAKLTAFCKTSGSRGLHIYIPLGAKYTYKEALNFTKLLCVLIQNKLPNLTTLERAKNKRGKKIYLDFLQNRKGQTIVAPYSVRPKPGATVSAPVTWKEIKKGFDLREFNIKSMPSRLDKIGDLYEGLLSADNDISKALQNLQIE